MTIFIGMLILIAVVYLLFLHSQIEDYCGISNFIGETIAFFFTASLIFVITYFVIGMACLSSSTIHEENGGWTEIYSMKNSSSISGSFFLGCGNINGEDNYTYFAKDKNGGMHRYSVPTNSSSIFQEDKGKAPCVHTIKIIRQAPKWIGYGFDGANMKDTNFLFLMGQL